MSYFKKQAESFETKEYKLDAFNSFYYSRPLRLKMWLLERRINEQLNALLIFSALFTPEMKIETEALSAKLSRIRKLRYAR